MTRQTSAQNTPLAAASQTEPLPRSWSLCGSGTYRKELKLSLALHQFFTGSLHKAEL